MFIFYDFETSSRDLLGQILNYAFVITDAKLTPISELSGYIRLNRTQLPEPEAILVNQLDLNWLQKNGENEWEAADSIFNFLQAAISNYGNCCLAGFNSNSFDLGFLRNLLISYGFNPYFEGKLSNKDLLHFSYHLAFQNPETFPWVRIHDDEKSYYSFKLEDLASEFGLLDSAQTHDAKDDVLLTIALTKMLEVTFKSSFADFQPFQIHLSQDSQLPFSIGQVKQRHFARNGEPIMPFKTNPYLVLARDKKMALCINLDIYSTLSKDGHVLTPEQKLSCIQYVNENKHFFILNPLPHQHSAIFDSLAEDIFRDSFFLNFSKHPALYFDAIKKPWDIAYQIHELGFDHIPKLRGHILNLIQNPESYSSTLQTLLQTRRTPKDTYLIQLYNRAYLNIHPNPDSTLFKRYLEARYVTGSLLKSPDQLIGIKTRLEFIESTLNSDTTPDSSIGLLLSLKHYTLNFQKQFES